MTNPKRFYKEVERFYVKAWQSSKCKSDSIAKIEKCMEQAANATYSVQRLSHFLTALRQEIKVIKVTKSPYVNLFGTATPSKMLEVRCVNAVVLGTTSRPGGGGKAWVYVYLIHPNMSVGFYAVLAVKQEDALKLRRKYVGHVVRLCVERGSINAVYPLNKAYRLGSLLKIRIKKVNVKPQLPCTPPELIPKVTRGAVVPSLIVEAPKQVMEAGLAPSAAHLLILRKDSVMLKDIPNKAVMIVRNSEIELSKDFYIIGPGDCIAVLVYLGSNRGYVLSSFDCECKSDISFRPYIPAGFISDQPIDEIKRVIEDKALDRNIIRLLYYPPLQKLGFDCGKWLFSICRDAKTNIECILEVYSMLRKQGIASIKAPTMYFAKSYSIEDLRLWLEEYCCQDARVMQEVGACCHFIKSCSQNS